MVDYGLKIMKDGYGITDNDIRNILMSSKYPMLKYHSDNTNYCTFNAGDSHKYVDFSHSLGYVPAFVPYFKYNGKIYNINATGGDGPGGNVHAYSFSDSSKVRCGLIFGGLAYKQYVNPTWPAGMDDIDLYTEHFGTYGFIYTGNYSGNDQGGAMRFFTSIPQGATVVSATLNYIFAIKGSSGQMKLRIWGINEDNTGDFTSNPLSRSKTSAYTDIDVNIASNTSVNINVASIVQEIVNRGGWSPGNAIGFVLLDNGSDDNAYAAEGTGGSTNLLSCGGPSMNVDFRCIIFKDKIA